MADAVREDNYRGYAYDSNGNVVGSMVEADEKSEDISLISSNGHWVQIVGGPIGQATLTEKQARNLLEGLNGALDVFAPYAD